MEEVAEEEIQTEVMDHQIFLKLPRRIEALMTIMTLTLFSLQRRSILVKRATQDRGDYSAESAWKRSTESNIAMDFPNNGGD